MQVGAVQTCRGSHTHSVVAGPTPDGKILVYNSGTGRVREEEELDQCIDDIPGDDRTALFRIDVIEIPVDDPSQSSITTALPYLLTRKPAYWPVFGVAATTGMTRRRPVARTSVMI